MREPLRLQIIGAHPDDADYHAGGLAALFAGAGHCVQMLSLTNGQAGHQSRYGADLAALRRLEAAAAGRVIGAEYLTLDHPDGELLPTLERRWEVMRLIRRFRPHILLTHRPNDYHPDHRYTSQLVQDAAFLVTVPGVVADTQALAENPLILYMTDTFQKPYPFDPSIVVDVGEVVPSISAMLHEHRSQFYDWLPFLAGTKSLVPEADAERLKWLDEQVRSRLGEQAMQYRQRLEARGADPLPPLQFAEAYEVCEYGAPLTETLATSLFAWCDAIHLRR